MGDSPTTASNWRGGFTSKKSLTVSEQAASSFASNVRAASTDGLSISVPCSCSPLIVVAPSDRNLEIASAAKAASPHDGSKMVSVGRRIAQLTRKVAIGCGVKNAPRAFLAVAAEPKGRATMFARGCSDQKGHGGFYLAVVPARVRGCWPRPAPAQTPNRSGRSIPVSSRLRIPPLDPISGRPTGPAGSNNRTFRQPCFAPPA